MSTQTGGRANAARLGARRVDGVGRLKIITQEWLERRCGFKDQYSLWHAVLGMAGAAGCMKYDGEIYRNFTYQEALHIDKNDWKALKMTCGGRQKRCPEFRFCRDKYDLARQHLSLIHI